MKLLNYLIRNRPETTGRCTRLCGYLSACCSRGGFFLGRESGFLMKVMIVALLAAVSCSVVLAAETQNPDKTLSMGFDATTSHLDDSYAGQARYQLGNSTYYLVRDAEPVTNTFFTGDVKMPMNDWLTLNAHGGTWTQQSVSNTSKGYTLGGGFRVYFH